MTAPEARPLLASDLDAGPAAEPVDHAALAKLHADGFGARAGWPEAVILDALEARGAFLVEAPGGFAIGRAVAGEAELHTLVVAPPMRRRGTARRLLAAFAAAARARGATEAFLEVAEPNAGARALYAGDGWEEVGRRRGYYGGADALVMRKAL